MDREKYIRYVRIMAERHRGLLALISHEIFKQTTSQAVLSFAWGTAKLSHCLLRHLFSSVQSVVVSQSL